MIVVRPVGCEPDLLSGNEHQVLSFIPMNGTQELTRVSPPKDGWTHAALEAVALPTGDAWDAFLGSQWVGSSEV